MSSNFSFFANFSFHIDDHDTDLYFFETGPVAIRNANSSLTMYMPVQCATAFQRLFLLSFDMIKKTYRQSQWILHNGVYAYLFYDPQRERLFGLRDVSTFTLIIEEYDLLTLKATQQYTKQDGNQYAFPYQGCVAFDYQENWIVEVRTRFEDLGVNAYFVRMDLNLIGEKDDIVTDFHLLPNVGNLCSMTYDIKTKLVLATWQHGSIDRDLVMLFMNPYNGTFSNQTTLLKTPQGWVVESVQSVFLEDVRQVLFVIEHQVENDVKTKYWLIYVEFDTMNIRSKKQITKPEFDDWQLFIA